jgi:hypothetical protein
VIFAAVLRLFSSEANAQPLRGVVLVDVVKFPPKASAQAHLRLRAAMEEALTSKNWFLAPTNQPIADCGDTSECMGKIATDTTTQYVLRVSGKKTRDLGYDITLDLFTTATGYTRSSHAACDFCDPATMSKIASDTAVEMLTSVLKEEASKEEASQREKAMRATAPVPPIAAQAPAPALQPAIEAPPPEPQTASRLWIPWTMVGVGALGLAYGGWAMIENGKTSGASHRGSSTQYGFDTYSSKPLGIGALAVGGALFVAGGIWIGSALLTASPNHVALSLRF